MCTVIVAESAASRAHQQEQAVLFQWTALRTWW